MLCLCFLIVYLPLRLFAQDDIRLAADGRLEVLYNGQWGTVCDDLFGDRDAVVACRQLGYKGGISIGNSVNDGSGKIWLDNLRCKGSEGTLAECRRNDWGLHNCNHPEDVGIRCDSINRVTEEGLWGDWLSWSVCSTSCGAGIQKRQRNCDSPPPYLGGGYCSGLPLESRSCNNMCCPSTWSEWSICPVSCGGGIQHRLRDCHIQSSIWNDTFCDASRENRLCNNTCCSDIIIGAMMILCIIIVSIVILIVLTSKSSMWKQYGYTKNIHAIVTLLSTYEFGYDWTSL